MAEKATIARPYARAAFEFAQTHGTFQQWSESLSVAAAVTSDPSVTRLLNHPSITAAQLVQLIADVAGSRLDASAHNFIATLAQNRRSFTGMIGRIRPALVVRIVDQTRDAPQLLVLAEVRCVMPHRGLDGQGVFDQGLRLRVFREQVPSFVACHRDGVCMQSDDRRLVGGFPDSFGAVLSRL